MSEAPLSCCDPGERIDVTQVNFDLFVDAFSFTQRCLQRLIENVSAATDSLAAIFVATKSATKRTAAPISLTDGSLSLSDVGTRKVSSFEKQFFDAGLDPALMMDGYVDHLRLPASSTRFFFFYKITKSESQPGCS